MRKIIAYIVLAILCCLACQCKHEDLDSELSSYIASHESQIRMLRNWDILYAPERDCWWCRHYYCKDSLLSFVLARVDKYDNVIAYEVNPFYEDSTIAIQMASQNISTLYDIKRIYGYEFIGAREVKLFNDTLAYDFLISMGDEETTSQIKLKKTDNDSIDKHLFGKWYIRTTQK